MNDIKPMNDFPDGLLPDVNTFTHYDGNDVFFSFFFLLTDNFRVDICCLRSQRDLKI